MRTFDYKALKELAQEELKSLFKGKKIRVTTCGITSVGDVMGFSFSENLINGFMLNINCSVIFVEDLIVEILN